MVPSGAECFTAVLAAFFLYCFRTVITFPFRGIYGMSSRSSSSATSLGRPRLSWCVLDLVSLRRRPWALTWNGLGSQTLWPHIYIYIYIFFFFFSHSLSLVPCLSSPLLSSHFLFLLLYAFLFLFNSWSPLQQWWVTRRRGWRHCPYFFKGLVKGVMDVFPERGFHR